MRLAKHLAHAGVASRRAAEQLVFAGRVTVGGEVVRDPARDVTEQDEIAVDRKPIGGAEGQRAVYIVNKPAGVVSTAHDTHGRRTIVDLVKGDRRLYPVGRLDADTTGALLLGAVRTDLHGQRGTVTVLRCGPPARKVPVDVQWDGHAWRALATG